MKISNKQTNSPTQMAIEWIKKKEDQEGFKEVFINSYIGM